MRKKNIGSPPPFSPKVNDGVITQVREYELMTPLFGGGVEKQTADPVTLIRGTEIRGQLRFWWRACRGGQFDGDLAKMKAAEDRLWGKANKKNEQGLSLDNTVQIVVENAASRSQTTIFTIEKDKRGRNQAKVNSQFAQVAYAAFPIQPDQEELKKANPQVNPVQVGVTFKVSITFPESKAKEIEAALWAWETFGGIGGRTRRGFGALRLQKLDGKAYTDAPLSQNVQSWIKANLAEYIPAENFPTGVPHLSRNMQFRVTQASYDTPLGSWGSLIGALRNFRQMRKGERGRSLWPEADAIRRIVNQRGNSVPRTSAKFPRAAFGLPVIFHFPNEPQMSDVTLKGTVGDNGLERLASPLILRPFLCSNNRAVGIALLLEGTRPIPGELVLSGSGLNNVPVHETLTRDEAKDIQVLNGETDVLKAFMNTLR